MLVKRGEIYYADLSPVEQERYDHHRARDDPVKIFQ